MLLTRIALLALLFCAAVTTIRAEEAPEVEVEAGEEAGKVFDTFSEADRATITSTQETHQFQAEVTRLMDILINSLYSNREIFIRELVSNAADALDKMRFLALTDDSLLGADEEIGIQVSFDEEHKTITITDQGVGMTKADLMSNLGVVAKSGTTDFLDAAAKGGAESVNLIGQFGVGFYSVYLVADKVTVVSKNANDEQHIWESTANNEFTISQDPRGNTLGRGTSIVLHLKEDAEEFMDEKLLEGLITRYSQFINFPITLKTTRQETKEVSLSAEELADEEEEGERASEDGEEVEVSEEEDDEEDDEAAPTTKTVTETVVEWKVMNEAKPLWTRNPKDVSEDEYTAFYTTLSKDPSPPLDKIHFVAEGEITFRAILYVPREADAHIYDKFYEKSTGLKLYVRRVLISDEFEDFLPRYMNFVKGIVDSDDLPLNVSRETLAQSRVLKVMSKKLTRKVLEMVRKMADRADIEDAEEEDEEEAAEAEEVEGAGDYEQFWSQYSKSIKMGVMDDKKNKAKLIKLLRYPSSTSDGKLTSFEHYVDRMGEEQTSIYFLTCETLAACEVHPVLEGFRKRGVEVLFMAEAVDEYCVQHIHEFDGIEPVNAGRVNAKLPESAAWKAKRDSKELQALADWLKGTLKAQVSNVHISNKLTGSPAAVVAPEYGWTGNMERIMRAQAMQTAKDIDREVPKRVFEVNPFHPIVQELAARLRDSPEDTQSLEDLAWILYDSASVVTGYTVANADDFAKRLHKVISLGLGLDPEAPVLEEEEEEDDEVEVAEAPTESPVEEEQVAEEEQVVEEEQ